MALTLEPWNVTAPLVVGEYYEVHIKVGFMPNDTIRNAVEWAIYNAPQFKGPISIKRIEWEPQTIDGKADGVLFKVNFQALPHPLITEAGFDMRIFLTVAGAAILAIMAFNGTLKEVFHVVDDGAKAAGSTATTLGKVLDPLVLIGIALVLLVGVPLLRKG